MKTCTKCGESQDLECFGNDASKPDGKRPSCKACKSLSDRRYRLTHVEEIRAHNRTYHVQHADLKRRRAREWYKDNPAQAKASRRKWYEANPDKVAASRKRFRLKDPEGFRAYMNAYMTRRYHTDMNYRVRSILNARIRSNIRKNAGTMDIVGCSMEEFVDWIEVQFDEHMTWDNMGSYWHFDHVTPCASFDLSRPEQVMQCFDWKNLRPLEGRENMSKGDKILPAVIEAHAQLVQQYLQLRSAYQA